MLHITNDDNVLYMGEEPKDDVKYYGKLYQKNGSSYQGYFLNGKKTGYGEERLSDGSYHKGFYQDNQLHGKVVSYVKSKGSYIDGYYQDGQLNGECLFYDEKSVLVNKGMFKNGKSCVATYETIYKTLNCKQEKVYEGFVYEDKYNGFGKLYQDGKVYIGNFTTGRKDGRFLVCYRDGTMVYNYQTTNLDIMIGIDNVTKDNFTNYKNTVTFNNDMFDDEHKIVYKENGIVKYIGKLNSELKYNDDSGSYYIGGSTYSGRFENGKFISGSFTFPGGKYKGGFNGYLIEGNGMIEFDNGNRFTGEFENNKSKTGKLTLKHDNQEISVKCRVTINDSNVSIDTLPETEITKGNNRYVGNFKLMKTVNDIKLLFIEGKHYINNILTYEGDFKNFRYNGTGTKYHPNGNIMATGFFEEGEPFKAEYYDDTGNLIYSDSGDGDAADYNMPPLVQGMMNNELANLIQTATTALGQDGQNIINNLMNNINTQMINQMNNLPNNQMNNQMNPEDIQDQIIDDDDENEEVE
jgi:hypothetical protein